MYTPSVLIIYIPFFNIRILRLYKMWSINYLKKMFLNEKKKIKKNFEIIFYKSLKVHNELSVPSVWSGQMELENI